MGVYLKKFLDYLENTKKASDNTIESYKRDILKYTEYINSIGVDELTSVSSTVILNYLLDIQKKGKSAATAARSLSSIRAFYKYLHQKGYISENPTNDLHTFKTERKAPSSLNEYQIELLLSTPDKRNIKGYRDKAMLEIMYATGMRASDLIKIKLSDVNLKIGYIMCTNGEKERIIPIYSYARDCLKEYIEKRTEIPNSNQSDILFLNRNGAPLTRQGLWKIIKTYQKKVGIPIDLTPHTLRHSFAIHLLENGADLKSVQELMGHSDISSTQVYEEVVKNKLSEVYEKAHPRAKHHR